MVARHEIIDIKAWDADVSTGYSLTPYKTLDVSSRADLSVDTLTLVLADSHPAMELLRTHRRIPVPVTFSLNGEEWSGLVTTLKQTKDGEVTVTASGDTKHAHRALARARSSSAIDGDVAQVEAPIGELTAKIIGEAAQRTGLPVYILKEHDGDVAQAEIGSEDTIADVLNPHLEASDTFVSMRLLRPGQDLPGTGDVLRVQGQLEQDWEQSRITAGAWPQAAESPRLKRASVIPPVTPMPRLSWAGWATQDATGGTIARSQGVCWMPFDIGQHDRGYWQEEQAEGVRVATSQELSEARRAGWGEHVTLWSAGRFSAGVNRSTLDAAARAGLLVRTSGAKIATSSAALSYIGTGAAYAWFNGTSWVLANAADFAAEDERRNPVITQKQTPAILVHIHAGRDRRDHVLFSASEGGGLEDWATTTNSPEAAMVHMTTQLSQATLEALKSGTATTDPVAGLLTPGEASQFVGELPDIVDSVDVNASPFSTVSGTDIAQHHLGGSVNMNAAGAFFYREMATSAGGAGTNPVGEIGRAYADAQGSTSIELTPGFSASTVFGDDVKVNGRVIPGWKPGDRVSFTEGITRISEVISGYELHSAWDEPLRVTPILARADNGILDTLTERLRRAESNAAKALLQNPRRVPKDDVDVVVDENETVKDAKQVAETANSAAGEAQKSADGKSTIFYGATTPAKAKEGDTWFKDVAGGGTVLMQYVNGKWVEKVNTKAIDDELAANQEALTELNDVILPGLKEELETLNTEVAREAAEKLATLETKLADADKALKQDLQAELAALDEALTGDLATSLASLRDELEALDGVTATEVANKLATLETKLANADKKLKQDLQGELAALDTALSGELTSSLTNLKEELEALDTAVAREAADNLATLETKLENADKALKQALQGELTALDEALSGELTISLTSLKEELEAADTAAAEAVATTLVQLENRLKAADKAVKDDLVAQLEELEEDLAALDPTVGEDLTSKLAALRTELIQADATVRTTLRGELSTLKTQLQNADATLKTDLVAQLNAARKALEDADKDINTNLSKRLEDARKDLKAASDTIAEDLAEVDSVVSRQRPGNLFPDPFFADSSWPGGLHTVGDGIFKMRASGVQSGRYYQPSGLRDSSIQFERGASYLMTADVRFGSTTGIDYVDVYARVPNAEGTGIWTPRLGRLNRVTSGPGKNSYTWAPTSAILTFPENIATGTGTIGFFVQSSHPDGDVWITNVRMVRAADNSLIIDGAVTAAKVQAGVIDADHIAAGAIVATKLAADSVVAGKIATNAVVAKNIKAGEITTAKIAADAVTANEIASDTILAKNIKAGQITTAKIASDAVTANEIAANAVTANAIKAGEVTTAKLAADAVTANKIAADAVTANAIKAGEVTTAKLAADAVTANKLAADSVLAKNIKAGQITTAKLGANQVTTEKIAAGAVTADELQAENATIDKLWANGIAAKSVTTNRILVANNGNMLPEISSYVGSTYPNLDPYEAFGKNSVDPSMWLKGDNVNATIEHAVNMVAGQKYRFSYQARASVNGTKHYISMHKGNSEKKHIPSQTFRNYIGSNTSTSAYVITNQTIDRAWKTFEVEITPEESGFAYFYIFANHPNGTTNPDYQWFKDVRLEKMTGATLIEDGAITTNKIAANAVTANAIKADSVTSNKIKSGEVAAKHLAADAVTANKLLAEDATINKLWTNGLAAKSITASRIAVSPGNMFPDPDFQDPSWGRGTGGTTWSTGRISLIADGTQNGVYLQPEGQANAAMQHTPGVNYLLTANLRFGGNANITKFSVYARMERDTGTTGATKVGEFVRFPTDGQEHASYRYRDNSAVLDFSSIKMAAGGYFTLGFFVESSQPSGTVEIRNVRLTPMSGTTLIEDGAITTGKVAANAITANKVASDQILAKHVKSDQILAKHVKAGEINAEHLLAEEATIDKLWANGLVAKSVQTASLSVGAANLYRDPALLDANSFDSRRSDTGGYGGGGSFTVAPSTATSGGYDTLGSAKGRPTRLVPGVTYYVSAMVRPDRLVSSGNLRLYLRAYPTASATGTQGWASPQWVSNSASVAGGNWYRIEGTFKMHKDYEYLVLGFYVASGSQAQAIYSDPMVIRQHSSTMIADGAITTGKVAAHAITADELAANSVTANAIKAGEVTAAKIASDAVSATKLLAEDATIDKLWANGIAAKSVVTNRVLVAGNGNMLPEIATYAESSRPEIDPYPRPFGLNTSHPSIWAQGSSTAIIHHPINLVAGQKYRFSYRVNASVNGTRHFWQVRNGNADGVTSGSASVKVGNSTSSYIINNEIANTSLRSYAVEFEAINTGTYYLQVYPNHSNGTTNTSGYQWFRDLRLEKMTGATLIEDGAVTTNKIAADAVTAESIKAGEITSDHISSSKISSDKITVKNGFISNAMIGNGQVNNAKIANLDASKITAGTINANRIGTKTIEGKHLAVDTIEANQIKANVFTQVANSVLPLIPGTVTPTWTDGLRYVARSGTKDAALPAGIPGYYRHSAGSIPANASRTVTNTYNNVVSIDPNLEYEATWWVRSSSGSPRYMYVTLEDQNGNTDIVQKVEGVDDDGEAYSKHTWGNPIRVIITTASTTWTKYSTLFTFKEGTKSVRVNNVHFNNGANSNASYLYIAGLEISPHIIPQREVDARQDDAIGKMQNYIDELTGLFYSQSAAYAKKFNELSEPMSGGLVAGQNEPGVMTTTTSKIVCDGTWTGHILVHIMHKSYDGLNVERREVTGSSREFGLPSVSSMNRRPVAIHWFKRPGRAYATDMSRGAYAMPQGEWTTVSTATVGTGEWNLSATVGWDSANNHGAYGIRILVNGSEVARVAPRTGLGPLLPIGSGYRTQSLSASGNGNGRSTKFEIQAYIGQGTVGQRRIRKVTATLDWTKLD